MSLFRIRNRIPTLTCLLYLVIVGFCTLQFKLSIYPSLTYTYSPADHDDSLLDAPEKEAGGEREENGVSKTSSRDNSITSSNAATISSSLPTTTTPLSPSNTTTKLSKRDFPKLTEGWWTPYVNASSRVYKRWIGTPHEWCLLEHHSNDTLPIKVPNGEKVNGLLFVKSHKASSTTGTAVNNAIAHHVARRKLSLNNNNDSDNANKKVCRHFDAHEFADGKQHAKRTTPSLMWSFVRQPQARDVSEFFHFLVSRKNISHDNLQLYIRTDRGRQSKYLLPTRTKRLHPDRVRDSPEVASKMILQILEAYDFIGVTERMEESLAVITLLWDLEPTDVIVLAVKQAGGYDGKCYKIQKAFLSEESRDFLVSDEYVSGHADFLLYAAAQASLDRTIIELGVDIVRERAALIRQLQSLAYERCHDKVTFVCSDTGEPQHELAKSNCYDHDAGCGYPCVDQVMKEYRDNHTDVIKKMESPVPSSRFQNPKSNMSTTIPRRTEGWWTPYVNKSSIVYPKWNGTRHEWCIVEDKAREKVVPLTKEPVLGLLYVKTHKASSTTLEGVNNAIAHHVARRKMMDLNDKSSNHSTTTINVCHHYNAHEFADDKHHARRKSPSLLWTFLRHPQSKDLSAFFHFKVSRENVDPGDVTEFRKYLSSSLRGKQTEYLSPFSRLKLKPQNEMDTVASTVTKTLRFYDFVGITERMAESLAVMTILWDLDPTDVIVLSVNKSGGFDNWCRKIQKAFLTEGTREYLMSDGYAAGQSDFLLYYAANASLDRTIAELGVKLVEERTALIKQLQSLAHEQCHDKVIPVCSNAGEQQYELAKSNCYVTDAGCGYPCVDRVMKEYRENNVMH